MRRNSNHAFQTRQQQRGISLIELMISLLLGLIVVGGAGAIFLSNKRVYGSTETVARIQENTRTAFELMARDLREAGGMPCRRQTNTFRNFLNGGEDNAWWTQWSDGLKGYDANIAMPAEPTKPIRTAGTAAIDIHSGFGGGDYYTTGIMANDSAVLQVNRIDGLKDGEVLIVCDSQFTGMFQATSIVSGNVSIQHNSGAGEPGNCNMKFFFGDPPSRAMDRCNNGGTGHRFPGGASLVQVRTYRWYIGNNTRGSRSLYRAEMTNKTANAVPSVVETAQEIAEGVSGMNLQYMLPTATDYVAASAVTNWAQVSAIRITLTMEGVAGALTGRNIQGTDNAALQRTFTHVVSVRNHNP